MNENHTPDCDPVEDGIRRRKPPQAGPGAPITKPSTPGLRPPVVRKARIAIRELTPEQATEYYKSYATTGRDPSIAILLSMFLYRGGIIGISGVNHTYRSLELERAFFSGARVHRIIQAVISGEADKRVKQKLQENLNRVGTGMRSLTPFWCGYSGWLKRRIIGCFHTESLQLEPSDLFINRKLDLEELIKLPLREQCAELS